MDELSFTKTYLDPVNGRKSFYKKAYTLKYDNFELMFSYNTLCALVLNNYSNNAIDQLMTIVSEYIEDVNVLDSLFNTIECNKIHDKNEIKDRIFIFNLQSVTTCNHVRSFLYGLNQGYLYKKDLEKNFNNLI